MAFARVEAEEQPEISMDYDVAAVPTLLFMEGEKYILFLEYLRLMGTKENYFQGAKSWTALKALKWQT